MGFIGHVLTGGRDVSAAPSRVKLASTFPFFTPFLAVSQGKTNGVFQSGVFRGWPGFATAEGIKTAENTGVFGHPLSL